MTKNLLRILLLILVNVISTAYLKAQDSDSVICLKTRQIDFLILEQVDAQFLRKDTSFKASKIKDLNRIVLKQADIQSKTESIVKLKDLEIKDAYKSYSEVLERFNKEQRKVKLWRNGAVILGSTTVITICLLALLVN